MKIEMRGRWGCGCDMRACEMHQRQVATDEGGATVIILSCRTHLNFVSCTLGVDASTMEGLDMEASRLMNLLHEESCR